MVVYDNWYFCQESHIHFDSIFSELIVMVPVDDQLEHKLLVHPNAGNATLMSH